MSPKASEHRNPGFQRGPSIPSLGCLSARQRLCLSGTSTRDTTQRGSKYRQSVEVSFHRPWEGEGDGDGDGEGRPGHSQRPGRPCAGCRVDLGSLSSPVDSDMKGKQRLRALGLWGDVGRAVGGGGR